MLRVYGLMSGIFSSDEEASTDATLSFEKVNGWIF